MNYNVVYSLFTKEEELKNQDSEKNVAIVVFIGHSQPKSEPIVYEITDLKSDDDVETYVKKLVSSITTLCNYHYEFINRIGNVYFFK